MSNSRIFCWGFLIASIAFATLGWFGVESRYTGMSALVGKFMLCAHTGFTAVAIWGDRAKGDPA